MSPDWPPCNPKSRVSSLGTTRTAGDAYSFDLVQWCLHGQCGQASDQSGLLDFSTSHNEDRKQVCCSERAGLQRVDTVFESKCQGRIHESSLSDGTRVVFVVLRSNHEERRYLVCYDDVGGFQVKKPASLSSIQTNSNDKRLQETPYCANND